MKIYIILFLVTILVLPICGSAHDSSTQQTTSSPPRTHLSLLFDPGFSMMSGAEDILTIHYGITREEDTLIGLRWFSEDQLIGKSGGIITRCAKYALIDIPVDYFSVVAAHEYAGHGARYRELNISNVYYGFDPPPPYGKGGGEASVNIVGNSISNDELLGIWQGGMEVHQLINRQLALRWLNNNKMNYRDAFLYFWSWQIRFAYIKDTEEYLPAITSDTDPSAYIRIINRENGFSDPAQPHFSVSQLKSRINIDLVNPFVFFALYTGLKTFMWDGDGTMTLPVIRIGAIEYLPLLRTALTPFGLEYHFENYVRNKTMTSLIDVRIGDQSFYPAWGGIGVILQHAFTNNDFSTDVYLDLWKQPALKFNTIPGISKGGSFGGALSLRGIFNLTNENRSLSGILEIGYKTVGFLEGYRYDASPVFRFGVGFYL